MTSASSPEQSVASSPTVAIIGMEGSGKTVLATTLAKRLSTIDARGIFLNPQGVATLKYIEGVWRILQSGDWPPSTPQGELFELKWKFEIVGELVSDVRLIDAAGQDLRMLFGDEQINSVESLPEQLRLLAEYCRSAHIVLFLINLGDFVGEGNPEHRTANEAAIKAAMDYLSSECRPRRVCLVLTQADLYHKLATDRGGWLELVAQTVPYVYGAHLQNGTMAVLPVAAISQTTVVVDADGIPRRVPVAGFRSAGLGKLADWIAQQVREVTKELRVEADRVQSEMQEQQDPGEWMTAKEGGQEKNRKKVQFYAKVGGVGLCCFMGLFLAIKGCSPSGPRPVVLTQEGKDTGSGYGKWVSGKVVNKGAAGTVTIRVRYLQGGTPRSEYYIDVPLGAGESYFYKFVDNSNFRPENGPIEFKVWAE